MQVQRTIATVASPDLVVRLPPQFLNRRVEVIVLTLDEPVKTVRRRSPPSQFKGKVREWGDVMSTVCLAC
jgi:hypothetical protein